MNINNLQLFRSLNIKHLAIISTLLLSFSAICDEAPSAQELDQIVCGEEEKLAERYLKTPYINQGNYPWCSAATTYGQLGHLDFSLKDQPAEEFYTDKKNLCSLYSLAHHYNKNDQNLDIDLNQSFSHLEMLISLQKENTTLYSEESLPFDHICQLNSHTAQKLQKEIDSFDSKLVSPTAKYIFNLGDNTFTCSKEYYDKHDVQKRVRGLNFILANLINEETQEKCLINNSKLKNFDLMLKHVTKDKRIQPFRIHRFVSTNPISFMNHILKEDRKKKRAPIQLSLCASDIHQGENLSTSSDCEQSSHSVLFVGSGLDSQGSCQMKFANSWGKDEGKSFSLSPKEFYDAIQNRLKYQDKTLETSKIEPTTKWEKDNFHQIIDNSSSFKGKAQIIHKNGKRYFKLKSGQALYKKLELENGGYFRGRAVIDDQFKIHFKEGKTIREDGSYRQDFNNGTAQFHKFKINEEKTFTGMANITADNKIDFLHGLLELADGSSRDLDEDGNVTYHNYQINDDNKYSGTAILSTDNTITFITGTLVNTKTGKKQNFENKKIIIANNS